MEIGVVIIIILIYFTFATNFHNINTCLKRKGPLREMGITFRGPGGITFYVIVYYNKLIEISKYIINHLMK